MKNISQKIKSKIKKNSFLLKISRILGKLYFFAFLKKIFFPSTERFDLNADQNEIEYVNSYASSMRDFIKKINKNNISLLDVGSGYGHVLGMIDGDNILDIVALDKIEESDFKLKNNKVKFIKSDITNLFKNNISYGKFDVISCTEFIEHISEEDGTDLIKWIYNSLNQDGIFIGSTPNNKTNLKKYSNSPFHLREYSVNDFSKILKESGFVNIYTQEKDDFFVWSASK